MAAAKQVMPSEEPLSPFSRLFSMPGQDCFNIITLGCKTEGNAHAIVEGLKNTLINHPRFSSILETGLGENKVKAKWIPTIVKVEDHVIVPDIDPNIENPDQFLEDYTTNMALSPMDKSKPLWEFHLLQLKTSYAGSVAVARFHHSLGDGMSLMSLLLACIRKTCDLQALPTFVVPKKSNGMHICWSLIAWFWFIVKLLFHTCVEVFKSMVIVCFVRDNATPLKDKSGATISVNKFIHRIFSLDDVKVVKNAMNMTVNDVLLGVVQAGLSRYLSERFERSLRKTIYLRGVVFFNLRPNRNIEDLAKMMEKGSKSRWGNSIGYVLFPLWVRLEENTLEYIRRAKITMDRKKLSLEPIFSFALLKFTIKVLGLKALMNLVNSIFSRTSVIFTNVVGPCEEISFFDHEISYIAASSCGVPQGLTIHMQSYVKKVIHITFVISSSTLSTP
ncbi:O-acyltransferase (WSD1-like) family protein [Raphanus sativus]|nr:O-acyltransferase (WSD1-like) family protein [Raphanus sativus]